MVTSLICIMAIVFIGYKLTEMVCWRVAFETNSDRYLEHRFLGTRRIELKPLPTGQMRAIPDYLWEQGYPRGETYRRMGKPPSCIN